jgi:hypothetical protein
MVFVRTSFLVFSICIFSAANFPADQPDKSRKVPLLETYDGPYETPVTKKHKTSPAYRSTSNGFFFAQVNVDSAGNNILNDAANEPSIAVNPMVPENIVIGWRQFDNIGNSFRQAGYGYTNDGGMSWTFPGVIEPGIFRSDPVLGSDADGTIYYNSLSVDTDFSCQVFRSYDGGATWDGGTFAHGGDKQWMVIDKTGGLGHGNNYSYWTAGASECFPGSFTRSTDMGSSFQDCLEIPGEPFWGTLAVGPEGDLYIGGAGGSPGFLVLRSSTAKVDTAAVTWDTSVVVDLDGDVVAFGGMSSPNPSGLLGQTWIATDISSNPSTSGNVYLLCSVERFSNTDPLDVMFARSTDGGLTWSAPVRVNDDPGEDAWQWFGTMSVAPDGRIDVIWLDTRDNPGTLLSSLYYSYSVDAGESWSVNERLTSEFDPHVGWPQQQKMGDYFHMESDSAGTHLAWAATFNGEQDVYYGRITTLVGVAEGGETAPVGFELLQNYPNPFNPKTDINYRIHESGRVTLSVHDVLGREISTLVDEPQAPGFHRVTWDAGDFASGIYFYRLKLNNVVETRRMALLR